MSFPWPPLEFTEPAWLWALLLLPFLPLVLTRSLVDLPRRQMLASLLVRSVIVTMLILALSGLSLLRDESRVFVVFAVDESLSVGDAGQQQATAFIRQAVEFSRGTDFAVLPFASQPGSFTPASEAAQSRFVSDGQQPISGEFPEPDDDQTTAWRKGSNLQAAFETAAAGVPPNFVPHIVILTDGNETAGDLLSATASAGVRVSAVVLPMRDDPEIQVSAVNVPAQVAEGEPFNIEVLIDANHDDEVLVEVFRGDFRVASEQQRVRAGENRFSFSEQITRPTEFSARIRRPSGADGAPSATFRDTVLDNNTASGLVFTSGKPRILLIAGAPETAQYLEWAMDEEGIAIDVRPTEGMPESLADLQNYEVLILSDVPATDLTTNQMELIRSWVSDLGGGFVMLGGEESFGLGGYYRTVVEEVLPVRSDFEKEKEKPGLGMVLIIDKSGSMGGQKIELAKEAARAAVDLLGDKDQIGVIAFDGSPYWVSEIKPGTQKGIVLDRISSIEAGGGTALYPAMEQAFQALQSTNARLKHVIILTDGYSTPGDFDGITQDMAAARITVSTVGIGDADQALLERIAEIGSGRYYFSSDASAIPQIFARETITAGKSGIREEPFLPVLVRATAVLADINFDEAPFLLGYVVTRPKATSEVILVTESGDPLLVWWRYGLGISAAFTSDATSRWAAEWLTWPGFNRFWAQVIRHCMRKQETSGLTFEIRRQGDRSRVVIEAVGADGRFLNEAETELTLIGPQLKTEVLTVRQTAPGRYEADVDTAKAGAWQLQITQKKDGLLLHQLSQGLVVGYHDELRLGQPREDLLRSVTEVSGGRLNPDPAGVFESIPGGIVSSSVPLWPWMLLTGLVLFVLDVALRRLEMVRIFGSEPLRSRLRS